MQTQKCASALSRADHQSARDRGGNGLVVNPRVFQAAEGRPTIPRTHVNLARVFRAAARRPPRVFDRVGRRAERAATTPKASRQAN